MHAVTFVLSDEMADVWIAGLQWFILIPRLNHTESHRPIDIHSKPYLHREKKKDLELNYPAYCNPTNYKESNRSSLTFVAFYDIPKRKAEVLFYTVKKIPGPHGEVFPQVIKFLLIKGFLWQKSNLEHVTFALDETVKCMNDLNIQNFQKTYWEKGDNDGHMRFLNSQFFFFLTKNPII